MKEINKESGERMSWWEWVKSCSGSAQDRRNQYTFTALCLATALSYVTATWFFKGDYALNTAVRWTLATLPAAFGLAALLSYLKFLRETDEMLQQIQLKGLAIGFGIGILLAFCYPQFENLGAPPLGMNELIFFMCIGWAGGQLIAMRNYR